MAEPSQFLDENGKWHCTQCGACCLLGPGLLHDDPGVVGFDRGDGGCIHLTKGMRCSIYEERPRICRTHEVSPGATDLERATACAGLKTIVDREIATGKRCSFDHKWRFQCP